MKILITGGNSAVALKLLKAFTQYEVVLADYGDVPMFATKDYKLISLGIKNEDVLAHTLLNNCLDEGVDAILPLHNFEIEALAKSDVLFSEFNISLLLPNVFELSKYFVAGQNAKSENWAIFNDGALIFSSSINAELTELAQDKKLNGAFYLTSETGFNLLTI